MSSDRLGQSQRITPTISRRKFLRASGATLGWLTLVNGLPSRKCEAVFAQTQESPLQLVSKTELPQTSASRGQIPVRAMACWAQGNVGVVAAATMIHIVEFSDPAKPQIKTVPIPNGEAWDTHIEGNFLYAGLQISNDQTWLLIYDITNPLDPKLVGKLTTPRVPGVHNLFVKNKTAFLASFSGGGGQCHLIDVSDPTKPVYLQSLSEAPYPLFRVHDVTVIENHAYLAAWNNGFFIVDFENLDKPSQLKWTVRAHQTYISSPPSREPFSSHTHIAWPSSDGKILMTTDEVQGDFVRAWDISNLSDIKQLGRFQVDDFSVPHNVLVDGKYAYVSYYTEGVRVLDISNPSELKEVAFYDTDPRPHDQIPLRGGGLGPEFSGAYDVYPFGKYVLVSDMDTGLFIFEKKGILAGKS